MRVAGTAGNAVGPEVTGCLFSQFSRIKRAWLILFLLFAILLPSACASSMHPVTRTSSTHPTTRLPPITFINSVNDVYLLNSNGSTRFVTYGYDAEWVPGYQMMVVRHVDSERPEPEAELWLVNPGICQSRV
jgi:hypothetical protein